MSDVTSLEMSLSYLDTRVDHEVMLSKFSLYFIYMLIRHTTALMQTNRLHSGTQGQTLSWFWTAFNMTNRVD